MSAEPGISSDPLGVAAGYSTFAYANVDPVSLSDRSGLIAWEGTLNVRIAGFGKKGANIGFGIVDIRMLSECINGYQYRMVVDIDARGVDSLPFAFANIFVSFEHDDGSDVPRLDLYTGDFAMASAGLWIGDGPGTGNFRVGSTIPTVTDTYGLGFGIFSVTGDAVARLRSSVKCECEALQD